MPAPSGFGPAAPGLGLPKVSETGTLPALPALRELLPRGALARGSVLAVPEFGLLCLALAAGASAAGAWCGIAGIPEAGLLAAAGLGLDIERMLLVPDPGPAWPQVVASLLDGCELVLVRPPAMAQAPVRRRLEAALRRAGGVLLVAGDWPGAQVRLRVLTQRWTGLGDGHGRVRACCAEVTADGRGEAALARTRWLWLPAEDGAVAVTDPVDIPVMDTPFPHDIPVARDSLAGDPFAAPAAGLRAWLKRRMRPRKASPDRGVARRGSWSCAARSSAVPIRPLRARRRRGCSSR